MWDRHSTSPLGTSALFLASLGVSKSPSGPIPFSPYSVWDPMLVKPRGQLYKSSF